MLNFFLNLLHKFATLVENLAEREAQAARAKLEEAAALVSKASGHRQSAQKGRAIAAAVKSAVNPAPVPAPVAVPEAPATAPADEEVQTPMAAPAVEATPEAAPASAVAAVDATAV